MVCDSDDFALYHQTKTLINFWCKRRLNLKSFIQPSETLLVKLTEKKKLLINGGEYKSQSLVFFFGWLFKAGPCICHLYLQDLGRKITLEMGKAPNTLQKGAQAARPW